jgi:ferredoxin-thioredoxin reductase catalytic subunit
MDDFEKMLDELKKSAKELIKKSNIQINKDKLVYFKDIISELITIRNEYENKFSQLRTSTEKEVARFEYSKGGETIHRGYHCPSLVLDLIVGNAKRGRLLKRKPEFGKYSYEYGFDIENRLIRVRGVNEFTSPDSVRSLL